MEKNEVLMHEDRIMIIPLNEIMNKVIEGNGGNVVHLKSENGGGLVPIHQANS